MFEIAGAIIIAFIFIALFPLIFLAVVYLLPLALVGGGIALLFTQTFPGFIMGVALVAAGMMAGKGIYGIE